MNSWRNLFVILLPLFAAFCYAAPISRSQSDVPATATVPPFSHVVVVVMENQEAPQVLGSGAAPYLDGLAARYAVADQYYGLAHPSLPNYLALIGGDTFGVTTDCTDCWVDSGSLVDQIEQSGRVWRAYEEAMPSPCRVGDAYPYAQWHDPFIYFTALRTNQARCMASVVLFDQLATDLPQDHLPDFAFITPDMCHDMHDCSVSEGDRWLSQVVPSIVNAPGFQQAGVLFVTWDEGTTNAGCCDGLAHGGRIPMLIVSALARPGFHSNIPETHYSLLRTIEDAWALPPLGHAANAGPMDEYFTSPS